MSGRKGKGLRISDPFVVKSGCVSGIPPARFANHAPFSVMFSNATVSGKRCRHLSIIALPLSAGVGLITTIATVRLPKYGSYILAYQRPKIGGNLNSLFVRRFSPSTKQCWDSLLSNHLVITSD